MFADYTQNVGMRALALMVSRIIGLVRVLDGDIAHTQVHCWVVSSIAGDCHLPYIQKCEEKK
jgi:hypothetical protein